MLSHGFARYASAVRWQAYAFGVADLDQARRLPRFRDRAAMLAEQRAVFRKAVSETVDEGRDVSMPQRAAGDPRDLRGIPAISRGVGGVMPGTDPVREAIRRDEQRRA